MCLRYAFAKPNTPGLKHRFGVDEVPPSLKPRYNIAPDQLVPVLFNDSPKSLKFATWGILPPWAGHAENPPHMYNARGETVDSKPFFKNAFATQRCLMLADSFYEWRKPDTTPFQAMLRDGSPFAFAGIFTVPKEGEIRSVCMVTTSPNALMAPVHDRMPVILRPEDEARWLNGTPDEAKELLEPYPDEEMTVRELTKAINSSRKDSAELVQPATRDGQRKLV